MEELTSVEQVKLAESIIKKLTEGDKDRTISVVVSPDAYRQLVLMAITQNTSIDVAAEYALRTGVFRWKPEFEEPP